MNWEAVGALGEIVGAAAVVATLIFLTVQLCQNTRSVDESRKANVSQLYQFRANMHMEGMLRRAEASSLSIFEVEAKAFARGVSHLSNEELMFARHHHVANAVRLDNGLFQYQNGFLDDDYLEYIESVIARAYPLWKLLGVFEMGFRPEFLRLANEIYERRAEAQESVGDPFRPAQTAEQEVQE
jgi:hypothetical protein